MKLVLKLIRAVFLQNQMQNLPSFQEQTWEWIQPGSALSVNVLPAVTPRKANSGKAI